MPDAPLPSDLRTAAPAYRVWGVVLLAAAAGFGIWAAIRPGPVAVLPDDRSAIAVPIPIEPEGEYDTPPTTFRWTPGGDDRDFAQLIVYRDDLTRVWTSGPIEGSEVTIPLEAYEGIPAGIPCYWKIRETIAGRPRAATGIVTYTFGTDLDGYGPGENPSISVPIR